MVSLLGEALHIQHQQHVSQSVQSDHYRVACGYSVHHGMQHPKLYITTYGRNIAPYISPKRSDPAISVIVLARGDVTAYILKSRLG
jgi:hypothetical protein